MKVARVVLILLVLGIPASIIVLIGVAEERRADRVSRRKEALRILGVHVALYESRTTAGERAKTGLGGWLAAHGHADSLVCPVCNAPWTFRPPLPATIPESSGSGPPADDPPVALCRTCAGREGQVEVLYWKGRVESYPLGSTGAQELDALLRSAAK
jgi:hypothetical protein